MTANVIQAVILICSSIVAFTMGSRSARVRRFGFGVGLVAQPFWMATSWMNGQWAIFLLSIWFGFCHARGLWNLRENQRC